MRDATRKDLLSGATIQHKPCGGRVEFGVHGNTSMWRCETCWGANQGGFWKLSTISRWPDAEIAHRFEVVAEPTVPSFSWLMPGLG